MFKIEIVNLKDKRQEYTVYCARPSVLGNPFKMKSEADRDSVCDQYVQWFAEKTERQDENILEALRRIYVYGDNHGIVRLGCYCFPKRCHTETIKEFLEGQMRNEK